MWDEWESLPEPRGGNDKVSNSYGWLELAAEDAEDTVVSTATVSYDDMSEDQTLAFDEIDTWLRSGKSQLKTLGGYAGTGKTTLVSLIAKSRQQRIAFCAYTGKASNVLGQKLRASGVEPDYCGTIHGLIYVPETDEKTGAVKGWGRVVDLSEYDLIVVDEASMVDEGMLEDLQSYHVPILAVGDHGQLPPVKGGFNLMENPDVRLERIHRQAEGNPIIRLSVGVRERGAQAIPYDFVYPMSRVGSMFAGYFNNPDRNLSTAMLCFTNKKRNGLNYSVRRAIHEGGIKDVLQVKDLVVCLKNTRFGHMCVFNGMRGRVTDMFGSSKGKEHLLRAGVEFPDDKLLLDAYISRTQFGREKTISSFSEAGLPEYSRWPDVGMLFDYGYALTAHKAQGSEFSDVAVVLESMHYMDEDYARRWLYTAITRASQRLYLVQP